MPSAVRRCWEHNLTEDILLILSNKKNTCNMKYKQKGEFNMKKRIIASLLSGCMILSGAISVCAENTAQASEQKEVGWDTSKEDTITLTVINNFYTAGEKKLAEDYMELHPETKVVVDVISDNDAYVTKMMTSLSGDRADAPDIVHGNFLADALSNSSMDVAVDKGYLYDMEEMLDEVNPYNDGKKVREAFDEADIILAKNTSGGRYQSFLPFDKLAIAFFYNKDIFEEQGLGIPNSYEELLDTCEKLKDAGYDVPIAAAGESSWLLNSLADNMYRDEEDQWLVQPGDGLWDEEQMAVNKDFKFNEDDLQCDQLIVNSTERQAIYATENGVNTPENATVYTEFQKIAKYFPENWIQADSTQLINDFESQISPMIFNGSWNVGVIISDIAQLPEDMQFDWGSFLLPDYENAPEGMHTANRSMVALGNSMSIIAKDDQDHMNRVKDFYEYWYSPAQAQTCYEETLTNGNFVQGPSAIKGVTLAENLQEKLEGFHSDYASRNFQWIDGQSMSTQSDKPVYYDIVNQFTSGELDVNDFLEQLAPIYENYYKDSIDRAGYDLDPTTIDTAKE